jgi:propionaldehyde dehydrogenase
VFSSVDEAVGAAGDAQKKLLKLSVAARSAIIANMRLRFQEEVEFLANLAVVETGLGRVQDKIAKNHLAAEKTPGVEDVRPEAFTGDHGLTVVERAPFGVIGAVTPSTNPSETTVNNSIITLAGGNSVVFNPHPGARLVSLFTISLLNRAVLEAGGPANLMTAPREPSIETSGQLMKHPGIKVLLVTGGGAVVQAALQSGKRAICAGPGNPPVVVDSTADLRAAARHVIVGHSTDNNIVCIAEKEVLVVSSVADEFMSELERGDAFRVPTNKVQELTDLCVPGGKVNRKLIGKNAGVILGEIGLSADDSVRCAFLEVDYDHPLVHTEQLMPILPVVRVSDVDKAIDLAVQAEKGSNHTAMMHSRDLEALDRMARAIQVSIFVKNGPCLAGLGYGGEGYTAWSIAGRTGEGLTRPRTFTRDRRCVLKGYFRIV